jgi:hypothetical protein
VYQSIAHGPLVTAPGKSNTITIEVLGNSFLFTVDGHPLTSQPVKDPHTPLKDGLIGLYLESEGEVAFFNSALYAL